MANDGLVTRSLGLMPYTNELLPLMNKRNRMDSLELERQEASGVGDPCQNCGAEVPTNQTYCGPCKEMMIEMGLWEGDGRDNLVATE